MTTQRDGSISNDNDSESTIATTNPFDESSLAASSPNNSRSHKTINQTEMRNNAYSSYAQHGHRGDESSQAIYEEIEVQHQSTLGGGLASTSNSTTTTITAESSPNKRQWSNIKNATTNSIRSSKTNHAVAGMSIGSSSQEQSVSTWFPVPSLFHTKASKKESSPNHNQHQHQHQHRRIKKNKSPILPFDEIVDNDRHNIINSQNNNSNGNGETLSSNATFNDPTATIGSYTTSSTAAASPITFPNPNQHRMTRDRPWRNLPHNNHHRQQQQQHQSSPNNNNTHPYNRIPKQTTPLSSSSTTSSPRFRKSPSPPSKQYNGFNPFSSSHSADESSTTELHSQSFQSVQSMQSSLEDERYIPQLFQQQPSPQQKSKNPFDSMDSNNSNENNNKNDKHGSSVNASTHSTTSSHTWFNHRMNRSRISSKSPERQRIPRPSSKSVSQSPNQASPNTNSNTPHQLHSLLSCATTHSDPQWKQALQLLATSSNPKLLAQSKLSQHKEHNWTALHIAALSNPPLYIIYALLIVYPQAVREIDGGGRLPLHLASGSEASSSVLSILVRFYNQSVIMEDGRGLIPLHLALLRDDDEEMSSDMIRVLLGQEGCIRNKKSATSHQQQHHKDGCMRRGEHLNLKLNDVTTGMFGDNPNAIYMKERKKREMRMKQMMKMMNGTSSPKYSRGFAADMKDVDPVDELPYNHEYLTTLWEDDDVMDVDIFGYAEMEEAHTFDFEVQQCLKKLSKWKKSHKKEESDNDDDENNALHSEPFVSPACIPTPNMRLPIHMVVRRNYKVDQAFRLPNHLQNDIVRTLIHVNPSSLFFKDYHGNSPIMTYLEVASTDPNNHIDEDMIELLLGIRTAGFRVAPSWLEDIDIVESHRKLANAWSDSYADESAMYNPAMVACGQTLPLHVAISQLMSSSIIYTIYSCYPGAKYVQDDRNCTPLHCALMHSSSEEKLDMNILSLLIDERVVVLRDTLHKSALDLLIDNSKNDRVPIDPSNLSWANQRGHEHQSQNIKTKFQSFFHHSFLKKNSSSMYISEMEQRLEDLKYLPPWLRDYAFGTPAVQQLLINKVSSPLSTAIIFLHGLALVLLILFFASTVDSVLNRPENISHANGIFMIISLGYLILNGVYYVLMNFRLQIGWRGCILNIWSWVTLFGLSFTFVSSILLNRFDTSSGDSIEDIMVLSTASIGLLWAMVIGFVSRWCYGVSIFCLSTLKMIRSLLPTFIVLVLSLLSFMQMMYVVQKESLRPENQCISFDDEGMSKVCSIWGSIKISYYIVSGGEFHLPDNGGNQLQFLFMLFFITIFIIILHSVATSIVHMKKIISTESMVPFYWIPMLTHILLVKDIQSIIPCHKNSPNLIVQEHTASMQYRFEMVWDYLCASFESSHVKNKKWSNLQRELGQSNLITNTIAVRVVAIIVLPIWFVLGLCSFGVLWPPQCRKAIFTWSMTNDNVDVYDKEVQSEDDCTTMLRGDISRMKGMMYERFHDLQRELHNLKRSV